MPAIAMLYPPITPYASGMMDDLGSQSRNKNNAKPTPGFGREWNLSARAEPADTPPEVYNASMTPLAQYAIKVGLSALIIVAISEIAKRSTGFAALVASLPLTSLLAFVWLHLDGTAATEIGTLSRQIFWLVLPSLILFLLLPVLLERGMTFWPSLGFSMLATVGGYFVMLFVLKKFGVVLS